MSQNNQNPLNMEALDQLFEDLRPGLKNVLSGYLRLDRFEQICKSEIKQDPNLLQCTKKSLAAAIKEAAILGLEPGVKGAGHFLAFNSKVKGRNGQPDRYVKEAQFQVGYKGYLNLAYRSGHIISITAEEVKEKDHFIYMKGLHENLEHIPAAGIRGESIAYYAYARLAGGGFALSVMNIEEMKAHAIEYSRQQYNGQLSGTWKKNFDGMAKKTIIMELLKYLPRTFDLVNIARSEQRQEEDRPAERPGQEADPIGFLKENTEQLQRSAPDQRRSFEPMTARRTI